MEKLSQFAGAFVGSKILKQFNLQELLAILTGTRASSHKQAAAAQMFLDLTDNPPVADALVEVSVDLLKGRGIDENEVLQLIGSVSPIVGIDPPRGRQELVSGLRTIARRVVAKKAEDTIEHNATVVCPNCKFVHSI